MRRLTTGEKLGFGAGDAAINISMMSMSLILTFFYTDVFGLDPKHMAVLFLVVRLIDAVTDPLMGWVTDRIKWETGRYRAWLGIGAIPFGLSVYLVFANPEISQEQKILWAYITYIFNTLMFTLVTIPYISLIGVITDEPSERLSANTYRFVLAKGAVLVVTTFLVVLANWLGDGDKAQGFGPAMAIMGVISTLLLLTCFRTTEERLEPAIAADTLQQQFRDLLRNDQWATLGVACVLLMTGYLVRASIAFHYATYYLTIESGPRFAVFMSMWAVGGILATFISAWLTRRYCKVKVFRHSLIAAAAVGGLMFFLVEPGDWVLGIAFYFLLCLLSDINTPIFWASISEVVDYGEHVTGKRVSGLTFGSISFLQKLGMGIAGLIVGLLLSFYDYAPGDSQTDFTLVGISLMVSVLPAFFFLASAMVMSRFKITNEYYEKNLTRFNHEKLASR